MASPRMDAPCSVAPSAPPPSPPPPVVWCFLWYRGIDGGGGWVEVDVPRQPGGLCKPIVPSDLCCGLTVMSCTPPPPLSLSKHEDPV